MEESRKDQEELDTLSRDEDRRGFLKAGLRGALLLPYVAPAIDTVFLSNAWADDDDDDSRSDDDDDDNDSSTNSGGTPSPIANVPPPPPSNSTNSSNSSNR